MRKAFALARVNLIRFIRDRSTVFFVFVLPLGIVVLIGAQFGGDFSLQLGVAGADGPLAERVTTDIDASDEVTTVTYDDEAELLLAVERGDVSAGLSFPADFESSVIAGAAVDVGFITRPDGVGPQLQIVVAEAVSRATNEEASIRFAIDQGADRATATAVAAQAASDAADLDVITTVDGESFFGNMGQYDLGATSQLVLFMFLTGLTGSAVLIQSRQLGVTTRMMGTPTSVGTIIAGETLGRFAIVVVQGVYIVVATILIFGVNWGDAIGTAAILGAFALVSAAAAMLLGSVFRNDQQAGGVAVVAGIGLAALGGSMMPAEFFSGTMLTIARLTPHYWANEAFAELVRRGGTISDVTSHLGVLVAYAFGLLALATWRMKRTIA